MPLRRAQRGEGSLFNFRTTLEQFLSPQGLPKFQKAETVVSSSRLFKLEAAQRRPSFLS